MLMMSIRAEIAVIDDDEAVLESFRFMLEAAGYEVLAYPSALAFLESGPRRPRCLILDQHMPRMSGLELAARLRAKGLGIPIMLITAALSPAIAARAARLGIERVLEKPPGEEELIGFIAAHDPRG